MEPRVREGHSGTGPGAFTPDGCAVDFYARLPVGGEPDIIAAAVPPGARILELGCGAGRVTHPLVGRGFDVTAVDESPEMLARVRGARTVRSSIEELDLGETFDVVMLASYLVNTGDIEVRRGLLSTCRRHVADDGCVLFQREGDGWEDRGAFERDDPGGYTVRMGPKEPIGGGVTVMRMEYAFPDAVWTQTYRTRTLVRGDFEEALAAAGLRVDRYLTDDGCWVRALPATPGAAGG
ncbi:class I SAM-dependent methyltransferase [Streptomyces sp. NPDC050560]|uniref:class I SAM-dependent methyltransferase n=1 Tax=Streptomyces sp. NPDC050560 TaxID=3365630 RepID=UPI0037BE1206